MSRLAFQQKSRNTNHMNTNAVKRLLREACTAAGSESAFAHRIGVSVALVNGVLRGIRQPRGKILDALGLEVAITYRRKGSADVD